MSNTSNLSDSILQSSEPSIASVSFSSSSGGFFDSLKNINMTTWLLIILILAFLGFNIFTYLAKGTEEVKTIFGPLFEKLFGTSVSVTSQVVDVSAEGAKAVVGGTASAIQGGLSVVQDVTPNNASTSSITKGQPINQQQLDNIQQSTLNKALNSSQNTQQQDYEANEASSSVHNVGKSGWCYVGDDRGFRTCAQVGVNDTCMSGDIFPSQELCMNPNLRT
jgi:hypothetical protein